MAKFLNRFEATEELHSIIKEAEKYLIIISLFIKLNSHTRQSFLRHQFKKDFKLFIVYGKNEDDKTKSLSDHDMEFFKEFPNVKILFHKRLHAKMYLNEKKSLLTSMNLHDHSMNENIEFGILTKVNPLILFANSIGGKYRHENLDDQAFKFAHKIINLSAIEYQKITKKRKSFLGLKQVYDAPSILVSKNRYGYCIRTGVKIPFYPEAPYSIEAYHSWNLYRNYDYREKYCHSCGSFFNSSMRYPLCNSCKPYYNSFKK